jgi:uncharacterized membrane protein YeaQ/YmgE (transglycosylase-associated protein family)
MFVLWVVVRSIVGSLARYVMTKGGYRPIGDISPGVLGSLVGSGLFLFLGGWPDAGLVASVLVAALGATAVIFAQHRSCIGPPIRPVGASPIYRAILAALSSDT